MVLLLASGIHLTKVFCKIFQTLAFLCGNKWKDTFLRLITNENEANLFAFLATSMVVLRAMPSTQSVQPGCYELW